MCETFKPIGLEDTVEQMLSTDYKKRFIGEYSQVKIRYLKLKCMMQKWDEDDLDFKPTSPREIYERQVQGMEWYIDALTARAELEGIELPCIR